MLELAILGSCSKTKMGPDAHARAHQETPKPIINLFNKVERSYGRT